jgi:hypothetical protein
LQGTAGLGARNKLLAVLALHRPGLRILGLPPENTGEPLETPESAMKAAIQTRDRAEGVVEVQEIIQKIQMKVTMEIRSGTRLVITVGARKMMRWKMPINPRARGPETRMGIPEVIQASINPLVIRSTLRAISTSLIPHDSVSGQTRSTRNAPVHASRSCGI